MRTIRLVLLQIWIAILLCTCTVPIDENVEIDVGLNTFIATYEQLSTDERVDLVLRGGIVGGPETYYLGYLIRDLALSYHFSNDPKTYQILTDVLDLYVEHFMADGILRAPLIKETLDLWSRDQFGRDMKLLYEAYVYSGDSDILALVDDQANRWLDTVPRKEVNGFTLFPYGENGENTKYEINPNQNIVLASLFSYLYWEEASTYYLNEELKDIVYNEVDAALSLQKDSGALPLREGLPLVEDTNYGGYSGDMLYQLSQIWGEQSWIDALQKIGEWLYTEYSFEHPWNTPEDKPNFIAERYYLHNLKARLFPFFAAGIDYEYAREWIEFAKAKFPDDDMHLTTYGYFYQSIDPEYLGVERENKLSPLSTIVVNEDGITVNAISSEVREITLTLGSASSDPDQTLYSGAEEAVFQADLGAGTYELIATVESVNGKVVARRVPLELDDGTSLEIRIQLFDTKHPFRMK